MTDITTNSNSSPHTDHEYYYELCALATSGALSDVEWKKLKCHLDTCSNCHRRMQEYREIARTGIALLMPEKPEEYPQAAAGWSPEAATRELVERIASGETAAQPPRGLEIARESWIARLWHWPGDLLNRPVFAMILIMALAIVAYRFGNQRGIEGSSVQLHSASTDENSLRQQIAALLTQREAIASDMEASFSEIRSLKSELQRRASEVEKLRILQAQTSEKSQQESGTAAKLQLDLSSALEQRDEINGRLAASEAALRDLQVRYDTLRQQNGQELLRTASLETQIADLSARLGQSEADVKRHQDFLASDRDIRELMGARELFIADVFDVDAGGEKSKPYGRVFYTKNKSLIFYAFDLDQQRQLKDAAIFQAWGRHSVGDKRPLNMGIFYLDSEANKRWVLKFDDPKALAEIDAVFVTVEPDERRHKPSGKQLLFASLRTMPNHP